LWHCAARSEAEIQGTKTRESHEMQHDLHVRLKQPKDREGYEADTEVEVENWVGYFVTLQEFFWKPEEGEAKDMRRGLVGYIS